MKDSTGCLATLQEGPLPSAPYPELHPAIAHVVRNARPDNCCVDLSGEMSVTLVGDSPTRPKERLAVKFPRDPDDAAGRVYLEAMILSRLTTFGKGFAPLEVPRSEACEDAEPPFYVALRQVGGTILPHEVVRAFSDAEKQSFGQRLGHFVWQFDQLICSSYDQLFREASYPYLHDRKDYILRHVALAHDDPAALHPSVVAVLRQVGQEYHELDEKRLLTSWFVGHDDLRVDNMTFTQQDGGWQLRGIFDFGGTKPSTAEREWRHILPLGEVTVEAAIASYERASGKTIDRRVLRFWAVAQAVSALAAFTRKHQPVQVPVIRVQDRIRDMQYLVPDEDWSAVLPVSHADTLEDARQINSRAEHRLPQVAGALDAL